ncbi:hypothetical protein [Azospirillum sp. TSH100]|uniref:hypothetical protein n=1 Tax=Azospirillum sp. TSH100 TaxID=652764 RepID=UPI0010AA9C65|nr:hypothetical protein [Azospirillum sp. TSH100]QCG92159.1 hypothetical protein E6C72_30690 [Azospirillum sp. TSH100]
MAPAGKGPVVTVLALLLFVPSAELAVKFLGWPLTGAYAVGLVLAGAVIFAIERHDRLAPLVQRREWLLAAGWILVMAVLLAVVYPLAQSGVYGRGSDRDEALTAGIQALLDLRYPYYERTYFGGRLSPMPGALFLGLPFHLMGSVAIQNFVYGAGCILLAARALSGWRTRWLLLPLLTLGNIAFLQDYVTGGDFVLTSLYVGVAVWVNAGAIERGEGGPSAMAKAAFLGLALCSRPIYAVAAVALAAHALRRQGLRSAAAFALTAGTAAAILILPFYLYDPAAFLPSHILNFMPPPLRWLDTALPAAALLLATLPVVRPMDVWGLFAVTAAALGLILVPGAAVRMATDNPSLYYLAPPALYAAAALLGRMGRREKDRAGKGRAVYQ